MAAPRARVSVIGEALIDLVPTAGGPPWRYDARPGGSPFNVAAGLSRLGHPTALVARLSDSAFGRRLREAALAEGLDLSSSVNAAEPATVAVVTLDADGRADYDFAVEGTADWQWQGADRPTPAPQSAAMHFGSLASWLAPGADAIAASAARARSEGILVSYDPNVRPGLLAAEAGRLLVERAVACSHVVKASVEDLGHLYPSAAVADVAGRWLELGAELVAITAGADGATAYGRDATAHASAVPVRMVDTVGAGDAFTAGLLAALLDGVPPPVDRIAALDADDLGALLLRATVTASLACERPGADPPRTDEVTARLEEIRSGSSG